MTSLGQNRQRWEPQTPATAQGPSLRWSLLASSWLLLLLVGGGGLAWLAFALLALIGRRRSWWVLSVIYAVVAFVFWVIDGDAGRILRGSLYLVVLVHGLVINQSWLLLLWGRRENGLTLRGNAPATSAPVGPRQRATAMSEEAEKLLGGPGTDRSDYLAAAPQPRQRRRTRAQRRAEEAATRAAAAPVVRATPPAATATTPRSVPTREVPEPVAEADLVDVNTASHRALAKLPGMDRSLAKAAVAARTARSGFSSLEDFAATAGLQPHEIVRLRTAAFCSPRPRARRTFGRRVDF